MILWYLGLAQVARAPTRDFREKEKLIQPQAEANVDLDQLIRE